MTEKELGFLEKQFKQLGLKDQFTRDLTEELKSQPLTHKHSFTRMIDGNEVKSTLHLNKSERSNLYFINRNDMQVIKEGFNQPIMQSFSIHQDNKYTFKESYNMMMGRTVYTAHKNKLGEEYNSWSKINWSNKLANGNYEIKQYNDNYGFKLDNVLAKYPIKELANEQYKNSLINSLHRGNLQSVTFVGKEGQEEKMFIAPNIALGILNVYDANKQKLTTGQLVEKQYIGQELADQLKQRLEKLSQNQESPKETVKLETPAKETINREKKLAQKPEKPAQKQKLKIQ